MKIENRIFDAERALYHTTDAVIENCVFDGAADGESALKESTDFAVKNCRFALRYPLWHTARFAVHDSVMTDSCRAACWYAANGRFENCELGGIKALRECEEMTLVNCTVVSPEFGWRCRGITLVNGTAQSEYFLFESRDIAVQNLEFSGKYSFQYTENVTVKDSVLHTKDAFWHSRNTVVENCTLAGEYLGWYSENLTLRNCKISGTQPFCYCKGLVLENCTMTDCDLSFEYSEVHAAVQGEILSVKNPRAGRIVADGYGAILSEDAVVPCDCEIVTRRG